MVKINDSYQKKQRLFRTAMDLAKKIFPDAQINDHIGSLIQVKIDNKAIINMVPSINYITLYNKDYFDSAMELAKKYEEVVGGEEVILKKEYED